MNTDRAKHSEAERMVNAALADSGWDEYEAKLQNSALETFSKAARRRRFFRSMAQVSSVFIVLAGVVWLSRAPRSVRSSQTQVAGGGQSLPAETLAHTITEQEMLAMFPAGSCALAEINGQKQLVFFDERIAREGVSVKRR
jgi:hypothetical protein